MVDNLLNIFGVDLAILPTNFIELFLLLVRVVIGLGLFIWCVGLIRSWTVGIFGGRWLK